jgi:diguanylate cyclase (GGDEF)-like protein
MMMSKSRNLNIYIVITFIISLLAFFSNVNFSQIPTSEWVFIFGLVGAVSLLNYHLIYIPPKDNIISLDSAVYLATLYLFGLETTLYVFAIVFLIFISFQRKIIWWKHIFNFSTYTLIIVVSYHLFILSGGIIGEINTTTLLPYIVSLSSYFIVNILVVVIFFVLEGSSKLQDILKRISTDKTFLASYFTTMLLSLILGILLRYEGFFGLFLFTCIALLLSFAFDQHFKLYQDTLEKANKDYLTGLNNHGYFKELLDAEIQSAKEHNQPMSLALLDIDDFKKYNDLYGHIQGDHLLTFFGSTILNEANARKDIVARYGGEEFAILMPNTRSNEAFTLINTLRKKVNDSYFDGVEALPYGCLSFSAGIIECEKGIYNSSELLNKADQAMYYAKSQGKNIVEIFDEKSDYLTQSTSFFDINLEEAEQQLKIFLSKDVYTYRHSKRVFQYAVDMSKILELSEHEKGTLIHGALIHDIGKIEIPRSILNKKGKLEQHEWELIKQHVTFGKEIISVNKKLEHLIPLVELHHERFDGRGYPYGLESDNIPKLARILCIIDSFDAMTTERPYQKTKTFSEAIIELRKCAGKQFDPVFVEHFIEMINHNYAEKLDSEEVVSV